MSLINKLRALFREDSSHMPGLTGLRGLAAFWVLLYHSWVYAGPRQLWFHLGWIKLNFTPLVGLGGAGVTLFFVLSGFLLGLPFAEWQAGRRPRPAIGRYFRRRIFRVFPAYYVQLGVLLLVAYWYPGQPDIGDGLAFFKHLLMLFVPQPVGTQPINGVWWTLPIEFSFYLLLPVLAVTLRLNRWWLILTGSLLSMWLWRMALAIWLSGAPGPQIVVTTYQLPGSMDMFGLGMLAALLHVNRDRLPEGWIPKGDASRLAFLGILLIVASVYWMFDERRLYWSNHLVFYLWTPLLSLGTAAIVLADATGSRLTGYLFGNRVMLFAGLVSYSVYLWHPVLFGWLTSSAYFQSMAGYKWLPLLLLGVPLTYLVATISYLFVERPFMRFRRRISRSPRDANLDDHKKALYKQ